jgi:hypothetical protein
MTCSSTNTDLISKNARANLDAADKIAQAQEPRLSRQPRSAWDGAPAGHQGRVETLALAFIESLTGNLSPCNDALNRSQLAAKRRVRRLCEAVNAAEATQSQSDTTRHRQRAHWPIPYQQLSAAQFDEIRNLDQMGKMAGRTKDDFAV